MRKGVTKEEVLDLAKTMEVKFTVSGPPIGGGKSGINFNPHDARKEEVLKRSKEGIPYHKEVINWFETYCEESNIDCDLR